MARTEVGDAVANEHRRTIRKRVLGTNLRLMRERLDLLLEDAAAVLECHPAKISRIESAQSGVRPVELRALLARYGVTDPQDQAGWLALAREGRRGRGVRNIDPSWPSEQLTPDLLDLIGLESEIATCSLFQPGIVPGLLQTEAFATAVIQGGRTGRLDQDRRVRLRVRMERQFILTRSEPPPVDMWVVLGEAALRQQWGGPQVLAGQLARLVEIGRMPNVTLQVLPFSTPGFPGGMLPFSIYSFPDAPQLPVVSVESLTSHAYLEDARDTAHYRRIFDEIRGIALSPAKSEALVARLADQLSTV
ncbi:helix-turn-helix domain-containing protein [Uniformispora flossi]|uniref:helix-turn-helix domain-containing protein n=1 Tax=Uniformispora flossi TaxID=3390723 RepID=UPI003C2D1A23